MIARAQQMVRTKDDRPLLWDEGLAQRALLLAQLGIASTRIDAYVATLPVAGVTYVIFHAGAQILDQRRAARAKAILPRPLLDQVCVQTLRLAAQLRTRGASVVEIDAARPAATTAAQVFAVYTAPQPAPVRTPTTITPLPIAAYVHWLRTQQPFVFSRWGDGEWSCLLGHAGENCDGHPYSGALRADLTRVLEARPTYLLGLQTFAVQQYKSAIVGWLNRRQLAFSWVDADVLHRSSIAQRLGGLLESLRSRPVLIIGPPHLQGLSILPHATLLPIPDRNCYAAYAAVLAEARTQLAHASPDTCVCVSAGMMAKVLIHDLATTFPSHTLLDCGSLWDPYAGRVSRVYHRRLVARRRS
jgi:hypothetical protein